MKKRISLLMLVVVVLIAAVAGCSSSPTGSESESEVYVFGSSAVGGNQHTMGVAIEQLINEKVEGFKISSQATGGNVQNLNLLRDKEIDIAFATGTLARMALDGKGSYEGNPVEDVQILTFMYPGIVHLIVRDDEVNSLQDLRGKKISVGEVGSVMEMYFMNLLDAYEMSADDFKIENLSHSDASDAIKDGNIDAFVYVTVAPTSIVTELALSGHVHLISIEEEIRDKVVTLYNDMYKIEIAAGTYNDQDEVINTVGAAFLLVIDSSVPEDVGYQFVKTLYENVDFLAQQNKMFSYISLDSALDGLAGVPIHPGAAKYYKEMGLELE